MNNNKEQSGLTLYLRILTFLKPYVKELLVVVVCNIGYIITSILSVWMVAPVVTVMFESMSPNKKAPIPEEMVPGASGASFFDINAWLKENIQSMMPDGNPLEALKWLCLTIFVIFLLKNLFAFLESFWMAIVEQSVVRDLREHLYEKIINQSMSFFHTNKTGDLISNITNDINAVNSSINKGLTRMFREPIMILSYLAILLSISWQLTFISIFILPVSALLIKKIGNSLKRRSHSVQERIADITSVLQETISGIKVVKAFAMEGYENSKFREFTNAHYRAVIRQFKIYRMSSPLSETMGVGIMAGVIWYGGILVLQNQALTSEDFLRFLVILFSLLAPIKSLGDLNNNIQIALASGKRIFDVFDQPNVITEKPEAVVKKTFESSIQYDNVLFRYKGGGDPVLKGVNLQILKNQKIAFVGSSGAGKTTLVNLLPRFYDVTGGNILIDGVDVRDMTLASLRSLMGIVTQEVILFNDTVANNIAYGLDRYSQTEIERAAKLANAFDFISEMPEGFQTMIGERGMLLSGGQRQRISIARAILKNPPILIFDEATSSLDSESEFLIQEAIENLMKDRTVFIIAHRLSSIVNSDKIVVLENGKVLDEGSNEELLERSGRYRQLYDLQFST